MATIPLVVVPEEDLVVFDAARVADRSTFEEPTRAPDGIDDVFVNGRPVLLGGRYDAGAKAGVVIRG